MIEMRVYPKGCRYFGVVNGEVSSMVKITQRTTIECLGPIDDLVHIIVQPRGKKKWWLFRVCWEEFPRFVACAEEPDSLIMRAILDA
jgi:hypothetical protein